MTLAGAKIAMGANVSSRSDLIIRYGRIAFTPRARTQSAPKLNLSGFMILPGLVNAHDHLEFNLFPRLGHGPYPNATAWAEEIFQPTREPIATQLKLPKPIRLWWGGLKNLLNGVTSVAHHNPFEPSVFPRYFPVRVLRRFGWAHSLAFSPDVSDCFRRTPSGAPFIIHTGEGTDIDSWRELYRLEEANLLRSFTVMVHGVAIRPEDLDLIRSRGASLVWCPSSNLFTLGRTVRPEVLQSDIPIALGTDSALTAEGDLLDELSVASNHVSASRLYTMVTSEAARILHLKAGEGRIQEGGVADLVVVRANDENQPSRTLGSRPELVFLKGRLMLVSADAARELRMNDLEGFQPLEIEGRGKWFVRSNVREFLDATKQILGERICLAGRRVIA
jgi:cytosine/adenosine deaminase-related metal-dependent hydrolase